jgi:hypothetical protein
MMLMLNDAWIDANAVISELERVAVNDRRVEPLSVNASRKGQKTFRLEFRPLRAVSTETLEYDLGAKGPGEK